LTAVLDATVLAAIASPRRREILRLIWRDEQAAGAIHAAMPDVTFGAVSLHLGALARAGLVDVRADRQQRLYRARRAAFGAAAPMLEALWRDALWRLKIQAEMADARRGPRARSRRPRRTRASKGPRS
jgi:DNA-binding transcriptional ArsR family regulator